MPPHRRQVLTALGTTGVAALAGCSSRGGTESPTETARGGTESPTETARGGTESPTETAPPLSEHTTKLAAADGDLGDEFGRSVAMTTDGTTALVGAPEDEAAGRAYVFERSGGSWTQQAKFAADDGDSEDSFGESVAMAADGTTALVGAHRDEDPNGELAGSAYVFERSGDSWTQQAKLAGADGDWYARFGESMAITADGTTALVGAEEAETNGYDAGAAYVFDGAGRSWRQQAKLAAADRNALDRFGRSVAMTTDGTTALVGAPEDEVAGRAYVFERSGGTWTQQANLAPADGLYYDAFGTSVAVAADGTTALIGAPDDKDPNGKNAGAAYVFERAGGSWTQQVNLAPADGDSSDFFGTSVAVAADGTTAIVGAEYDEDPNGDSAGSAYVFERSGGSWTQQAKLAPADGDDGDAFGEAVAMASDGSTALVGAHRDEDPNGRRAGSAYVFERPGGSWRQ